jgi:hypothetical protein
MNSLLESEENGLCRRNWTDSHAICICFLFGKNVARIFKRGVKNRVSVARDKDEDFHFVIKHVFQPVHDVSEEGSVACQMVRDVPDGILIA